MDEELKLLPCPFCGDPKPVFREYADRAFAMCGNCGADVDSLNCDGDVRSAWNRRHATEEARDARAQALEEAAKLCEGLRDLKESDRADKAVKEALSVGNEADTLHRLRHHSVVNLFNGALERAAREIRALAAQPEPPIIPAANQEPQP